MDNIPTGKLVVNLSKLTLSSDHMSLLLKGLNFCPTPNEPGPGQNRLDLYNLHRRLRLNYYFNQDQDDSLPGPTSMTNQTNWFITQKNNKSHF